MVFNIRINGVNLNSGPFTVTQTSGFQPFSFQQELDDIVEIIFTPATTPFPGLYFISDSDSRNLFNSRATNFFPVNQCSSGTCSFKITPINSFPSGVTASVFLNESATAAIADYGGGGESTTISITQSDIINVKLSGTLGSSQFGMNFVTTENNIDTTVPWYNQGLATQMLVPSVYFTLPLDGTSIYTNTNLPVQLISYPLPNTFNVKLLDSNQNELNSNLIQSNESDQTYSLDSVEINNQIIYNISAQSNGSGADLYVGLNSISLTGSTADPISISFDTDLIQPYYSVGDSVPIKLDSGDNPGNFMVQLACGTLDPVTDSINSNTGPQNFAIPDGFFGTCIFSVIYPISATQNPSIIVSQPVTFTNPPANSQYAINSQILVTPSAESAVAGETITVVQTCGSSVINYENITVNTSFNAKPPTNYAGSCTFGSLATGAYEAANPDVTVTINNRIFFAIVPKQLINTQPSFVVRINSLGMPATGTETVDLQLNCQIIGQVKSWSSVALNSAVTLSLDEPDITGGPYSCTLSTTATSTYAQISSNLTLLTQITPAEFSAFVKANGLTPASNWIV